MIALAIILILLSLSAHELGHAFAMRACGVKIKEISLLGFGPRLIRIRISWVFGGIPLYIKLIPLGAYVKPENEDYEKSLTYKQKVHIYGAGVIANILFAGIVSAIAFLIRGHISLIDCLYFAPWILIGLFPRYTTHLVVPLGLAAIGLIIFTIAGMHPKNAIEVNKGLFANSGSVVFIVQFVAQQSQTWFRTLYVVAAVSLGVGVTQGLPFYPLDGGRIAQSIIQILFPRKRLPGYIFMISSGVLFGYLVVISLSADGVRLFKMIF